MDQDKNLVSLSKERRGQLSELVEYLHEKEKDKLHRGIRFTQKRLLSINIRVKDRDDQ